MSTNSLVSTMRRPPRCLPSAQQFFFPLGEGLGRRLGNSCCVWEYLHKSSVVKCEEVQGEAECYYTLPSQKSSTPQLPMLPHANSVSDATVVANSPYFTFSLLAT